MLDLVLPTGNFVLGFTGLHTASHVSFSRSRAHLAVNVVSQITRPLERKDMG